MLTGSGHNQFARCDARAFPPAFAILDSFLVAVLFSAIVDSTGQNVQQAFLRATSRSWGLAQVFQGDAGDAGLEPGAADYRTDANLAFVEGLTQLWTGFPNPPACVY